MSTAVRRAIYGSLAGDTTLNDLLASPPSGYSKSIYHQQAPQGAEPPYVIFNRQTGTPIDSFGTPGALESDVWLVKAVTQGFSADTAEEITARVTTLLNDASLSISGATLCGLRRVSDIEYPETANGVRYQHAGSLYRLVTTPS